MNVNIKQFMDSIRDGRIVVVVFSKPYLKSRNCLYELTGVMEHEDYINRLLPIVVDTKVRSRQFFLEIVKHWHDEIEKLEEYINDLNKIEPGMDETYQQELKEMKLIRTLLPKIKAYVDWQNALSLKDLQDSQFAPIIQEIKKKQKLVAS